MAEAGAWGLGLLPRAPRKVRRSPSTRISCEAAHNAVGHKSFSSATLWTTSSDLLTRTKISNVRRSPHFSNSSARVVCEPGGDFGCRSKLRLLVRRSVVARNLLISGGGLRRRSSTGCLPPPVHSSTRAAEIAPARAPRLLGGQPSVDRVIDRRGGLQNQHQRHPRLPRPPRPLHRPP